MAWEQHITRREHTADEGLEISLEEWRDHVEASSDLRPDGFYPVSAASEEALKAAPLEVFKSLAYIGHPIEGGYYSFEYTDGYISVTHPDDTTFKRMYAAAQYFGATVRDDDGNQYNEHGEIYRIRDNKAVFAELEEPLPSANPHIYGLGAVPCRDLTAMIRTEPTRGAMLYYTWYLGFLTAFNQARHSRGEAAVNYQLTEERTSEDQAFLRSYSLEHPENRFIQAALALIQRHDLRLKT